jgi:hypothetical protein
MYNLRSNYLNSFHCNAIYKKKQKTGQLESQFYTALVVLTLTEVGYIMFECTQDMEFAQAEVVPHS